MVLALLQLWDGDEMFEDSGLTRLSDFSGEEHLIDDGVDFVEVEDKIELADVVEILVENFDEIVDGFQVGEIVVSNVGAQAKIKPRVAWNGNGSETTAVSIRCSSFFVYHKKSYLIFVSSTVITTPSDLMTISLL